jgi:hypothetical protein
MPRNNAMPNQRLNALRSHFELLAAEMNDSDSRVLDTGTAGKNENSLFKCLVLHGPESIEQRVDPDRQNEPNARLLFAVDVAVEFAMKVAHPLLLIGPERPAEAARFRTTLHGGDQFHVLIENLA